MIINKKIKRMMLINKSQYLGSIVLIVISCILFSSFNITMVDVQENLSNFRIEHKLEDASFILQNPISNINSLENKYNLFLEERKSVDVNFDSKSDLRVLSATDKIDKYAVVKGRSLQNVDEILIDQGFAAAHSLSVGDSMKIKNIVFKIVGYMTTPDYVYPLKSENDVLKNPKTFGIAVVSNKGIEKLGIPLTYYSVKFNEKNSDKFKNALMANNVLLKWTDKKDNNRIVFIDSDLKGGIAMGKDLPIAILLLTCVLISIVLSRLIKAEFLEIGTLYAMGYTKKEIMVHYLRYPLIISTAGSIIGTLIGTFLVKPLLSVIIGYYNLPLLIIKFDPKYMLLSFLLPLMFLIPVTFLVINSSLKLTPLQLIRGGKKKTKVNFIEKRIKLERFKYNSKFKIRELLRSLPRTMLMVLGVTFASMLLLLGFATKDSLDYLVSTSYKGINNNYEYTFKTLQYGDMYSGEKRSIAVFTSDMIKGNKTFAVYGVQRNSKLFNLVDEKNDPVKMDQVVITKSMSDRFNIHVGDILKVKNKLNSKELTIKIDKIALTYAGDIIYMPLDDFNNLNGYPKGSYLLIDSQNKLNIPSDILLSVTTKQDLIDGYNTLLMPLKYMIGGIASIAFLIGLIVIYVVTSLLIEENKVNISMFKVLGYDNKEISSLILNSNLVLVLLGFIISVPSILISLSGFFNVMTKSMNITIPAKLNPVNVIFSFIVILVTYELSKIMNRKKILGISMAESLKAKNE